MIIGITGTLGAGKGTVVEYLLCRLQYWLAVQLLQNLRKFRIVCKKQRELPPSFLPRPYVQFHAKETCG